MLMNRAPHPNAARVFANWLLTKNGQTAYSTGMFHATRRLDVPTDHLPAEGRLRPGGTYWPSYMEESVTQPPELSGLLREQFGS
jgi:ABC-type Fe3+ transport system substrate-binding protein